MAAGDPRVLCPLDPAHEILKSRLQFHIVRCMKNHNLRDKWLCPYNAVHIVDKVNFQDHVADCPDYREVQSFTYKTDNRELVGILSVDQVNKVHNETVDDGEDNWDNNTHPYTYDPWRASENKNIVRVLIGAPGRQRREFRQQERRRIAQLAEKSSLPSSSSSVSSSYTGSAVKKPLQPIRPPHNKSIAEFGQPKPLRPPRSLCTELRN
ncbi:uncharacterized protein LOC107038467 [Diachasma alloeum]|uniref:uncharacterized protein LOC107038467 n=1 Tax=Diachasma alloeum TaxID=454923 RepID=UPI000738445A|nr:uncharacterized protein LOC107038467 [Diachasma alloeum]